MSLQSSSEFWDGITFWLAVVGTALLFVSVVTGIAARRFARSWSEEKSEQSQRDKRTHEQSLAEAHKETARLKLELERLKTPRNLSPEQQKRIGDSLRPFAPQSTEVVYQGDDEARRLGTRSVTFSDMPVGVHTNRDYWLRQIAIRHSCKAFWLK